jgi:hypothetical protein
MDTRVCIKCNNIIHSSRHCCLLGRGQRVYVSGSLRSPSAHPLRVGYAGYVLYVLYDGSIYTYYQYYHIVI